MRRMLPYTIVLLALLLLPTMTVTAQDEVSGNPTCADIRDGLLEYKLDNPDSKTYPIAAGQLPGLEGPAEAEIIVSGDLLSFNWSANFGVDIVIAKGGNGANIYTYDEALSGDGLHAPGDKTELSHINLCYDVNPEVDIEKATNGEDADSPTGPEITIGDEVTWTYVVTNTGDVPLEFTVSDDQGVSVSCPAEVVWVGESVPCEAYGIAVEGQYGNIGSVSATYDDVSDEDPSHYIGVEDETPPPVTGQGCTPGYWRQEHHYDDWTGYTPDELASDVLGVGVGDIKLGEAIALGGGGLDALLRHTVAALLNASNPDVGYMYSAGEVIDMFQAAYASEDYETTKDDFDIANNAGCPLGNDPDNSEQPDDADPPETPGEESQVTICHIPSGNPDNAHTITVGESAVPAHIAHGDTMGECQDSGGGQPENPGNQGKDKDKDKDKDNKKGGKK